MLPPLPILLLSLSGVGRIDLGGEDLLAPAGTQVFLPGDVRFSLAANSAWEVGWIAFQLKSYLSPSSISSLQTMPASFERAFTGFHQEMALRREPDAVHHWSELLFLEIRQLIKPHCPHTLDSLWERVRKDLQSDWSIDQLATQAGMSRESLRQYSVQETGFPPMSYVRKLRMDRAIQLLQQGYKVEVVSEEIGYINPFAFSNAFKKQMGIAPSHFQKLGAASRQVVYTAMVDSLLPLVA